MSMKINIYHLYPTLLDLYGDAGNVASIKYRCEKRGIEAMLTCVGLEDEIDFSKADIVILGGGGKNSMAEVESIGDKLFLPLKDYVENGGVVLAVCEGLSLLAKKGIVDVCESESENRYVGDIAIEAMLDGKKVIVAGFENHMSRLDIKDNEPLGKIVFGDGNDGEYEGVIYKNLVGTHMFGPVLPKNPEITDCLIKKALEKKCGNDIALDELDDNFEMLAKEHVVKNCVR